MPGARGKCSCVVCLQTWIVLQLNQFSQEFRIASATGAGKNVPVIAPGGHDTACAVASVPAEEGDGWAYLSSGTWSLLVGSRLTCLA